MGAKVDITGQRFGMLTATEPTDLRRDKNIVWRCRCDCGRETFATAKDLRSGNTKSCGNHTAESLDGKRFGRLTALYLLGETKKGNAYWHCRCDCGNELDVPTRLLKSGNTKSCGCLKHDSKPAAPDCIDGSRAGNLGDTPPVSNTSGVRGVSWSKRDSKWEAYIKFRGRQYHLGHYKKFEDAVKARKLGEERYFDPYLEDVKRIKDGDESVDEINVGKMT